MNRKITPRNFKSDVFRRVLTALLFFVSTALFSQIAVTDVFPTRVTTGSTVTVTGGSGWTNATTVSISGIDVDAVVASNDGMQLTFTIATTATSPVTNPTGNDVGPTILKIGDQDVYIGPVDPANQVLLEYIAPTVKQYNSNKDTFVITEVFTTWDKNGNGDNFWRSRSEGIPNDSHDLLAFTYRGDTYSTGVGDDKLEDKQVPFENAVFKAYSSAGVSGRPYNLTYLTMADKIDGVEGRAVMAPSIMATAYDVLIDGENGLDLGTGISNFNMEADISFYSGDGDVININSSAPDLLITQIAEPGGPWSNDIYYYADIDGDIVGRPILLRMRNDNGTPLFQWQANFYNMNRAPGVTFEISEPVSPVTDWGIVNGNATRGFRMVAFKLVDFEINALNLKDVNNINLMAGGTADLAFIAYNAATFKIKSPTIDLAPVSRYICDFSDELFDKNIFFDVKASIEGADTPLAGSDEEIKYKWFREFAPISGEEANVYSLTPAKVTDTIRFKVRVSNKFGAVDLPATLKEGGVPTYWNGTAWTYPKIYYDTDDQLRFNINPRDRKLIFSSDYNIDDNLDGCDCYVPAERKVTIPISRTLTLHNNIVVEKERPVYDEDGNPTGATIPAGTFTLENNASLIQIKDENKNSGNIIAKRKSQELKKYDFVYWSSPVNDGKFESISGGGLNNVYQWDVNFLNENNGTRGNWVRPSGEMVTGLGYIKRENSTGVVEANFEGVPNNGLMTTIEVNKTPAYTGSGPDPMDDNDKHSNLIGNPYPSAINAYEFLTQNTNLEGRVLIWNSTAGELGGGSNDPFYEGFKYNYSDQYITYNSLESVPPGFNGYIASGQGFIVKVDPDAATLDVVFNNSMRFGAGYDNSEFLRSSELSATTEKQLIWLALVNENSMASNILVGYAEGATNGKDRMYDAVSGSGGMRIYSILDDSDLLIQGRALPFQDSDEVPLGVELLNNGIYKIGIAQVKGSLVSDAAQGIYLEDTYNNIIHDLRKTPYSFTGIAGNIKDRFILRYTNTTLSVDGPQLSDTFVYVKNDQLHVKASKNIERVLVYDLSGKKLMDHKVNGNTDAIQTAFQFPKGVYLTEIKLETVGTITKKIMN